MLIGWAEDGYRLVLIGWAEDGYTASFSCVGAKNTAQSILKDIGQCCNEVIIKSAVDTQDVL